MVVRCESYGLEIDVPHGAASLTMGIDVQDERLEALVIVWGAREESWGIDRQTLSGDTSQPGPWQILDQLLDQPYRHASGQSLHIQAACIDSGGHRTTTVYGYAERKAARRVYAIIGRDGQRPIVSSPSPRRWGRHERQVPLYTIGVDAAKALWISRLAAMAASLAASTPTAVATLTPGPSTPPATAGPRRVARSQYLPRG